MSINYRSGWSADFAEQREAYWQKRLAEAEATITRLREPIDRLLRWADIAVQRTNGGMAANDENVEIEARVLYNLEHAAKHVREVRAALAQDAEQRQTHGRNCPCSPCQREDWDAIERGLAQDAEQESASG